VTVNVPQKAWQNVAIRTHDKAVKLARNLTRFPLPTRARVDVILSDAIGTPTFNKMRFFMLEFPFTSNYPKDAKNQGCRITPTKLGHRLGVLDQHWSRTYNMSEAILFFSECPIWRSGCGCTYEVAGTLTTEKVDITETEHVQIVAQLDYFHALKRDKKIASDSWLVLEDNYGTDWRPKVAEIPNSADLSISSNEQTAGGTMPGIRGFNDLTHVAMKSTQDDHWVAKPAWEIDCSRYASGPVLFFKGREHGSWVPAVFFQNRSNSSKYEGRPGRNLRGRMKQLESPTARTQGIHVYMRSRSGNFSEAGKAVDYQTMMESSRFCLAPVGNNHFSYRFYEGLEAGCIPVHVGGGQLLAYSPAVSWQNMIVRIESDFDFGDIPRLRAELLRRTPSMFQGNERQICQHHKTIKATWEYIKENEGELWLAAVKVRWMQRHSLNSHGADINGDDVWFR